MNRLKALKLFLLTLFVLGLTPAFALTYQDDPPAIKVPVTLVSGPEGLALDAALRATAEAAGLVYLSRDVPAKRVQVRIEDMPFTEAWTLLMRLYGDGVDDLFLDKKIAIVAPPGILERVRQRGYAGLSEPTVSTDEQPVLEALPVKNAAELADIVSAFFGLEVKPLASPSVLILKGSQAAIERAKAFLGKIGALRDVDLVKEATKKNPEPLTAIFYVSLPAESTAEALKNAVGKVAPGLEVVFIPGADAFAVHGPAPELIKVKRLFERLGVLQTPNQRAEAQEPSSTRVYDLGPGMRSATKLIEAIVGDEGSLTYDEKTGFLYVYAHPSVQRRVADAVKSILGAVPRKKPVEVEPGNTLLYYRTKLAPSRLAKYLEEVLPEASFVPIDDNQLLLVRGSPIIQRKVALILAEIDREDPAKLEARKRAQMEAEARKPVHASYNPAYAGAETLAKTLEAILTTTIDLGTQSIEEAKAAATTGVKIAADPVSNTLLLFGPKADVERALDLAKRLDVPPMQTAIRVWIEEVDRSVADQLGIDWQVATGKLLLGIAGGVFGATYDTAAGALDALSSTLSLLEQTGRSKRLLDTTLLTVNGSEANILSGGKLLIPQQGNGGDQAGEQQGAGLEEVKYGLRLTVTPYIARADADMVLDLNVQLGSLPQAGPVPNSVLLPESSARSRIRITPGKPIILGGVIGNEVRKTQTGIPVLKDIPYIGALFRTESTETLDRLLLIIVDAKVIPGRTVNGEVTLPESKFAKLAPKKVEEKPAATPMLTTPWSDRAIRFGAPVGGDR